MSKLDDALARFQRAVDLLEARADECVANAYETAAVVAESGQWKGERERLAARIASLEEESRTLAGLTEEVEGRLDGAITEIRAVLGRN
ncbi:MAG TPA: DUF4164 family protein [Micropepsaceae bacterium]|jgi:hypothetical protein